MRFIITLEVTPSAGSVVDGDVYIENDCQPWHRTSAVEVAFKIAEAVPDLLSTSWVARPVEAKERTDKVW